MFDISKFFNQLLYDVKHPLLFNSALFLFLFLFFLAVYALLYKNVKARVTFIVLFSIYFYYKSSGWYFILMILTAVAGHFLTLAMHKAQDQKKKKFLLITSIVLYLGILAYFKYTNFFIGIVNNFMTEPLTAFKIFLPLGISFYTFELISYTVDVYHEKIKPVDNFLDFAFYISFFPHLVAGPIVRGADLLPQIRRELNISKQDFGRAVFLIVGGLIKKAVISDYISSNFVDRVFDNPSLYSGIENLFAVYGYALQIYCDFSGYSDMAIGIALLIGFHLPENFRAPYQSASITEFWKRWHISLSSWLRDYLYISLGGNRKGKFKTYFNLMVTMLLGGLWHGANWKFMMWGGLHGLGLAAERATNYDAFIRKTQLRKFIGIIITFHIVCICWIFFRASTFDVATQVMHQIIYNFNSQIFMQLLSGYALVFVMFACGYILHFTPQSIDLKVETGIAQSPVVLQSLFIAVAIWLVIQTKSADVQPFIYFQF